MLHWVFAVALLAFGADARERHAFEPIDYPGCGLRPLVPNNGTHELNNLPLPGAKVIGGVESVRYSWPGICSLRRIIAQQQHICGANLVRNLNGDFFLITSIYKCIDPTATDQTYIAKCGIHDRTEQNKPFKQELVFDKIIRHPNYDPIKLENNIAILRVRNYVNPNNYVSAVCIPNEGYNFGDKVITAGWGSRAVDAPFAYTLHQVTKVIKPNTTCSEKYGHDSIKPSMICAGDPSNDKFTCEGDSGGPLYAWIDDHWILRGIVSFGMGCGSTNKPGVYTDVFEVKQWIHSVINAPQQGSPIL